MNMDIRPEELVTWAARIGSAALILIVGLWLAFFLSKLARNKALEHPRIDASLGAFLSMMIRYVLIILVLIIVLQQFGVQTTSLVAVLGASALAVGLALQGTLTNVASGIMIAIMRPYHIGDFVEVNGREGTVIDLDLFFTRLRSPDEQIILVPNGQGDEAVGSFASTSFGTRTFCRLCGSPLTIHVRHRPDEIHITAGTLDDPEEVAPSFHVYAAEAPSWMPMMAFLPRHKALRPKTRALEEGQTDAG